MIGPFDPALVLLVMFGAVLFIGLVAAWRPSKRWAEPEPDPWWHTLPDGVPAVTWKIAAEDAALRSRARRSA